MPGGTFRVNEIPANPSLFVAGLDIGSTTVKAVLFRKGQYITGLAPAGWDPSKVAGDLLGAICEREGLPGIPGIVAATGYGRHSFGSASLTPSEITCHARGAAFLFPGCRFVIDVGGQDAKAIRLSAEGRVEDFVMNDKCAAGTGRFLSATGQALGVPVEDLSRYAEGVPPHRINAMCTVFAESEVISLVNSGVPREAIIAGLHASIARRIASMAASVHPVPPGVFTGGVSKNHDIAVKLGGELGFPLVVPENSVYAGAIGAALVAWDYREKQEKLGIITD